MADTTIKVPDYEERQDLAKRLLIEMWHDLGDCEVYDESKVGCVFCDHADLNGDANDDDQVTMLSCLIDEIIKRLRR